MQSLPCTLRGSCLQDGLNCPQPIPRAGCILAHCKYCPMRLAIFYFIRRTEFPQEVFLYYRLNCKQLGDLKNNNNKKLTKCRKILLATLTVLFPLLGSRAGKTLARWVLGAASCLLPSLRHLPSQARWCCEPGCCEPAWLAQLTAFSSPLAPGKKDAEKLSSREGDKKKKRKQGEMVGALAPCPHPMAVGGSSSGFTELLWHSSRGEPSAFPTCILIGITRDSCWQQRQGREAVVCSYKELHSAAVPWHAGQVWWAVCTLSSGRHGTAEGARTLRGCAWKGKSSAASWAIWEGSYKKANKFVVPVPGSLEWITHDWAASLWICSVTVKQVRLPGSALHSPPQPLQDDFISLGLVAANKSQSSETRVASTETLNLPTSLLRSHVSCSQLYAGFWAFPASPQQVCLHPGW